MYSLQSVSGLAELQEVQILSSWGLSNEASILLLNEPKLIMELQQARSLPPFPPQYTPRVIEERFEFIISCIWEIGHLIYECPFVPNYEPSFVEYYFDKQIALFYVKGEIVVNRLQKAELVPLDDLLNKAN